MWSTSTKRVTKEMSRGVAGDSFESIFSFLPSYKKVESSIILHLKELGLSRSEIVQTKEGRWLQVRVYSTHFQHARKLQLAFLNFNFKNVSFSQRILSRREWAEKWKEDYRIQKLGKLFVVIPAWRKSEFKPSQYLKRIPIVIDPLSAFGSGEHETTQLVVRLMEPLRNRFVGTGTGILSISAAHFGAKKIIGFDNDKPSVACAKFNFKQNRLTQPDAQFVFTELAQFKLKKSFDLVCANVNSRILEIYRKQIVGAAKTNGWVLVSGILHQTYESFRDAFDGKDLRCLKVLRGRRWVAVLYKKV